MAARPSVAVVISDDTSSCSGDATGAVCSTPTRTAFARSFAVSWSPPSLRMGVTGAGDLPIRVLGALAEIVTRRAPPSPAKIRPGVLALSSRCGSAEKSNLLHNQPWRPRHWSLVMLRRTRQPCLAAKRSEPVPPKSPPPWLRRCVGCLI
ncbi:hypothetical protein BU16DRAFT_302048 [Lophium mytilinum]|uniref:Uncharacterized protein n=1 Tax=Lophium mytilinum TaxID=390894 RepID=A0A6A6R415_9PEZI|nr:hypothetical protein BU16DRAFT_302048 [Lophium mytilinum]